MSLVAHTCLCCTYCSTALMPSGLASYGTVCMHGWILDLCSTALFWRLCCWSITNWQQSVIPTSKTSSHTTVGSLCGPASEHACLQADPPPTMHAYSTC
jgi:hypothetical protein